MEFNILEFASSSGILLVDTYSQIFDFFSLGLTIDGVDYSILGIIFTGVGLTAFVAYTVFRWIL